MPRTPRPLLTIALLASIVAVASGALGVRRSIADQQWLGVGFEALLTFAGVFGVMTGVGRFRQSHAIALLCVAATVFVCAVLGFVAQGKAQGFASVTMLPHVLLADRPTLTRFIVSGVLALMSGLIVIGRRPAESMWYLGLGVAFALPAMGGLSFLVVPSWRDRALALPPVALAVIVFFGFFVVGGLCSVSLHCLIRAFEVGRVDPEQSPSRV